MTISPHWLEPVLKTFRKKVIYRTYGQTYQICAHLAGSRLFKHLLQRSDFYFHLPRKLCSGSIVGLQIAAGLFLTAFQTTSTATKIRGSTQSTMASHGQCTHIDHSYYNAMYQHLNAHFAAKYLRFYGVQPRNMDDLPCRRYIGAEGVASGLIKKHRVFLPVSRLQRLLFTTGRDDDNRRPRYLRAGITARANDELKLSRGWREVFSSSNSL